MKIFEWSRIEELTQGDDEFGQELLEMYLEDAGETFQKILQAQNSGNRGEVGTQAHILKGSSGNVGASLLFELAKNLENIARGDDQSQMASIIKQIEEGMQQTFLEIKAHYS